MLLGDIYFGYSRLLSPASGLEGDLQLFTREYRDPQQLAAHTANVVVDAERVIAVRDKPLLHEVQGALGWDGTAIIGTGFVAHDTAIRDWLLAHRPRPHLGDLFAAALDLGLQVGAAPGPTGTWININTPEDLIAATTAEQRRCATNAVPD